MCNINTDLIVIYLLLQRESEVMVYNLYSVKIADYRSKRPP